MNCASAGGLRRVGLTQLSSYQSTKSLTFSSFRDGVLFTPIAMAPVNFDDQLNIGSLTGTWLGTLFTGVGLLAVLTQLRSLLQYAKSEHRRWKESAAGAWASCIFVEQMPHNGIVEGCLPLFSGWLQDFYLERKSIVVSQDDRGACGKSSWSNLFDRMNITAVDLSKYGGFERPQLHSRTYDKLGDEPLVRPLRTGLADTLVENRSVSYGFSAAEFAALIILSGFRPEDFVPGKTQRSISYFGQMLIADHGQFSQVARFDPHHGFRDQIKGYQTDMSTMPVAQALDLALGMIRIKGRFGREWVIVPEYPESTIETWGGHPSARQMKKSQYCYERFIGMTEPFISDYAGGNIDHDFADVEALEDLLRASGNPFSTPDTQVSPIKAREVLNIAHAIAAITPWSIHPVVPAHLASALRTILEPYYKTKVHTVRVLQLELQKIPNKRLRPGGRNGRDVIGLVSHVVGDKDRFFVDGNGSLSFFYYEAMSLVFEHHDIKMEDVRFLLASSIAANSLKFEPESSKSEQFRRQMIGYLEHCYLEQPTAKPQVRSKTDVPDWALDVYGMFPSPARSCRRLHWHAQDESR